MIEIDSAEKKNVQVERYLKADGVQTKRVHLVFNGIECGDYTNTGKDFLLERKSWNDFITSVADGSLISQCIRMCENFRGPKYVAFEGDWEAMVESITEKWIKSKVLSIPLRLAHVYGIQFEKCADALELAELIKHLDHYASSLSKDEDDIYMGLHISKTVDYRIRPLLTVPRLGETAARNLIKQYGSLFKVIQACCTNPKAVAKGVERVGFVGTQKICQIFTSTTPVIDKKVQAKEAQSKQQKNRSEAARRKKYAKQSASYKRNKHGSARNKTSYRK